MSSSPPLHAEYHVDTRTTKWAFVGVSLFALLTMFLAAREGGRSLTEALTLSVGMSGGFFSFLWLYGSLRMFHHRYTISMDGISVFRRGTLLQHMSWTEVRSISRGSLHVVGHKGHSISFRLAPPVQREARQIIEALFQKSRDSGQSATS